MFDFLTCFPLVIAILFTMLQDHRRPLWPIGVMMSPLVVGMMLLSAVQDKIGQLLQQHCVSTQLYLQHDLNSQQLAKAIGTNRFYLSQYFSSRGQHYNDYINDLRIQHFISLYHKAIDDNRDFTVQQLAQECGCHSYSTFSRAFK